MSTSVRAIIDPYHEAIGGPPIIFLQGYFVGLPLINQALAAENPLGGGSFFVTIRSLLEVLEEIPASAVLEKIAEINANNPPPKKPVQTPQGPENGNKPPPPQPPTCGVEFDAQNQGGEGITNFRIFGIGFEHNELINIIENNNLFASTQADGNGSYSVSVGVIDSNDRSVKHTVHAFGLSSGKTSNEDSFLN